MFPEITAFLLGVTEGAMLLHDFSSRKGVSRASLFALIPHLPQIIVYAAVLVQLLVQL